MNGRCYFFQWYDDPMPNRARAVIVGFLRKIDRGKENQPEGQHEPLLTSIRKWEKIVCILYVGFVIGRMSALS